MRAAATAHRCSQEALPHVQGQGQKPGGPYARGWQPRVAAPRLRSEAEAESARLRWRRNSREELPHTRGQGQRLGGATPHPRSSGCAGAGGPRRAIPCSRSGGEAVRRYPSSKVRSRGCALLEQP